MTNSPTATTAALSEAEARALYVTGDAAHDFDHVLRVTRLALHLATAEGADQIVVQQAALLHDVPIAAHDADATAVRQAHHFAAAEYAQEVLQARGMDQKRLANVVHCIEAHRFRDQSVQPQTLEAQCLYDADKLDSMGAIGVARAFAFAGSHNNRLWTTEYAEIEQATVKPTGADYTPVHEFVYKLDRLYATLYTATARRIGAERQAFMQSFYEQLDAEMRQVYGIV